MTTDEVLWWSMVGTAFAAAGISLAATVLDRRAASRPGRNARFWLHIASYILMSISILIFALRGILGTS
jgi:hypothetical protein